MPDELDELARIVEAGGQRLEVRRGSVSHAGVEFPLAVVAIGTRDPEAPAIGFFGGVHGLERVGTHVVLSYLGSIVARLHWDEALHRDLDGVRMVFMPLVNPSGMRRGTRANAAGVDLMRNAPVDSSERVVPGVGGHRLSPLLPWFRGRHGEPMQPEASALCELVRSELLGRPLAIALDCHSGFGLRDRIWFPHAHTTKPFRHVAEVHALMRTFEAAHPAHPYLFEPQSRRYLAHGDLWDYLAFEAMAHSGVFLPFTLEMGSWRWIRKSPTQILSRLGLFNPIPADRLERVRRNHLVWLGFLARAARTYRDWLPEGAALALHARAAREAWFR
jgi:hypothetical protein